MIISVILMTYLFDQPMLMLGEIGKLSLKELKETETTAVQATVDTAWNVVPFNIDVPVLP